MKIEATERAKAVRFCSYFSDFWKGRELERPKVREWQEAYFQMLSWKNTFGYPFFMDIADSRKYGPYIFLDVPKDKADYTREYLSELGYGDIKETEIAVELITPEFDMRVDEYYFQG